MWRQAQVPGRPTAVAAEWPAGTVAAEASGVAEQHPQYCSGCGTIAETKNNKLTKMYKHE